MKQLKFLFLLLSLTVVVNTNAQTKDTVKVMVYNLLNFPDGRNDCTDNNVVPARWDSLALIIGFVEPDILMVCELQNEIGADSILNRSLNVNGRTAYKKANFVINQSSGIVDLNNMLFYNSNKLGFRKQNIVFTDLRDVSVYYLYGKDPNLSTHNDSTFLDLWVTHLKASSGASNEARRALECDSIRKYLDTVSSPQNVILGGDFNFYSSTEAGFQTLLSGLHPLNDPINVTGNWNNSFAHRFSHTQSTRLTTPRLDCGALGGMDSRFDFLMPSNSIMTGSKRVRYIPNSYDAFGNNGSTYNDPINDINSTSPLPRTILDALYNTSDHLPVVLDLEITYPAPTLLNQNLNHFKGNKQSFKNILHWSFNNTEAIESLSLEFSKSAIDFENLIQFEYYQDSFLHITNNLSNYYYRIKWTQNGRTYYSDIIHISSPLTSPEIRLGPNPIINNKLYLSVNSDKSNSMTNISIINTLGHLYYNQSYNFTKRPNIQIETPNLAPGVYYIKINNNYYSRTKKVIFY